MSYVNSLHHIVFSTKYRRPVLLAEHRRDLFFFLNSLIAGYKCKLLRLNGMEDHIHLLVDLHPTIPLSTFVASLKRESSKWMRRTNLFPSFAGWSKEYSSFSRSANEKDAVIKYIINQQIHHATMSFEDELKDLFQKEGLNWSDYILEQ